MSEQTEVRSSQGADAPAAREIVAYELPDALPLRIVPAPRTRPWIEALPRRFAANCLPLMMANQSGWWLLNPIPFRVTWDGREAPNALTIEPVEGGEKPRHMRSQFGHGIVTFTVPYLFRTPPGVNLLVRGPANMAKDGVSPLEGLVETDWAVATFAMHWQLTRIGHPVTFDADEPFCMLVPQGRGAIESLRPVVRRIEGEPELLRQYQAWYDSRQQSGMMRRAAALVSGQQGVYEIPWELHYTRGTSPGGASAPPEHQTRRKLLDFTEEK